MLYNLAGLYWRIIGNNYQGVECIRRSLYLVPEEYKDVPLVNLANILYRWGRVEDAVTVMRDALDVNDLEVQYQISSYNTVFSFIKKIEVIQIMLLHCSYSLMISKFFTA